MAPQPFSVITANAPRRPSGHSSFSTVFNRKDFGVEWNAPLETGGVLVGEEVTLTLQIQAALQA